MFSTKSFIVTHFETSIPFYFLTNICYRRYRESIADVQTIYFEVPFAMSVLGDPELKKWVLENVCQTDNYVHVYVTLTSKPMNVF